MKDIGKLPFDAVIFDLDGVVTKTALVHAGAWKAAFDEYMKMREERDGEPFKEFTHNDDYLPYVDGKPRYEGVKSFLESRNIHIPYGDPSDPPEKETVCGIGNRKNFKFREVLAKEGAEVFGSTVDFIKALKKRGVRIGVASSSKNCKPILESVKLEDLFETRVDGVVSADMGLKGKPEADIFVMAAKNVDADPAHSIVVEDAVSGVQAGRNGAFGLVIGVAREDNEEELLANGADIAVRDLSEIDISWIRKWFNRKPKRLNLHHKITEDIFLGSKRSVFFLDYDGSLTPIVKRPELAVLSGKMRDAIKKLSEKHTVAIVSGRMREDVQKLVSIEGVFYAGSHGFDIQGPGFSLIQPEAEETIPLITRVTGALKEEFGNVEGVLIEDKKFSVAVHYRLARAKEIPRIRNRVNEIVERNRKLRFMSGKKVFEIIPDIRWSKGMAMRWILKALNIGWADASVVYIGDDVTDEDAFRMLRTRGTSILVSKKAKVSAANFYLTSPQEVKNLFEKITELREHFT
ncbi:MAG: trehalose-phosphatase [Candidatus Omnitrophota bacterium]